MNTGDFERIRITLSPLKFLRDVEWISTLAEQGLVAVFQGFVRIKMIQFLSWRSCKVDLDWDFLIIQNKKRGHKQRTNIHTKEKHAWKHFKELSGKVDQGFCSYFIM